MKDSKWNIQRIDRRGLVLQLADHKNDYREILNENGNRKFYRMIITLFVHKKQNLLLVSAYENEMDFIRFVNDTVFSYGSSYTSFKTVF